MNIEWKWIRHNYTP